MQIVDSFGPWTLSMLETGHPDITWKSEPHGAWLCFMMSLMIRTPKDIAALKAVVGEEFGAAHR
jgi:hypothetical protein